MALLPIFLFFYDFSDIPVKTGKTEGEKDPGGLCLYVPGIRTVPYRCQRGLHAGGNYLGQVLAGFRFTWILVPIAMVIGYFIVKGRASRICIK